MIPHLAARNRRWGILEWNPSVPVSNTLDVYEREMALIEQYRPALLTPWAWGHTHYVVQNAPFETALRGLITRIKNTPPSSDAPQFAPYRPTSIDPQRLFDVLRGIPSPDSVREDQRRTERPIRREIGR